MEKISIVIPTLNRISLLKDTLKYLQKDFLKDYFDCLYILNTSKENLDVSKLIKYLPDNYKLINYYPYNLLESKNNVLQLIKSKWVLILDDDLQFRDILKRFYSKIKKYNFDLGSGLLINKNFYKNPDLIHFVTYGRISFYGVPSLNYKRLSSNNPFKAHFLPGGFLLAKTNILKNLKYDTNFLLPFYGEDTDITYRAYKKGKKLYVFKDIKAFHLQHQKGGVRQYIPLDEFFFNFGFNNSYFIFKHFGVYKYFLYLVFRFRDFAYVLKQFKLSVYKNFVMGIVYAYKKTRN